MEALCFLAELRKMSSKFLAQFLADSSMRCLEQLTQALKHVMRRKAVLSPLSGMKSLRFSE